LLEKYFFLTPSKHLIKLMQNSSSADIIKNFHKEICTPVDFLTFMVFFRKSRIRALGLKVGFYFV
jgi:hypothetical protein